MGDVLRGRSSSQLGLNRHERRALGLDEAGFLRPRDSGPLRFAIADPPYPGLARKCYGDHPDFAGEVDYAQLVERLADEYDDGWALFMGSRAAVDVAKLCPSGTRVLTWVKPDAPIFPNATVAPSWEPIYLWRGRRRPSHAPVLRDYLVCGTWRGRRRSDDLIGAKPPDVARFVFEHLGCRRGDDVDDLYPGSGAVGRAWDAFTAQDPIPLCS